ncbi:MAG: sensor histidine kinase [Clostridiales bacterium]|nr:sensor histidine kinase [Clostridiales bacterium]
MKKGSQLRKRLRIVNGIFRFGSIQSIITLSFAALTILAMILIGLAFFSTFAENAENNAAASTQQIMTQANINLENYLDSMKDITDMVEDNMEGFSAGNTEKLNQLLTLTLEIRDDIVSAAIYSDRGDILLAVPGYNYDSSLVAANQRWFIDADLNPFDYIFQPPHVQRIYSDRRPWVVTLSKGIEIENPSITNNYVSVVDMNFSVIEEVCSQVELGRRGYIYVVDSNGDIIYHPQQQLIYAGLKEENILKALNNKTGSYIEKLNGEERSTVILDIGHAGWKMVGVSYVDEIVQNRQNFNNLIILILLIGIIFIIIASIFISYKISQPIKQLEFQMNRIEKGDFNIDLMEVRGEDEVKHLTRSFNLMIARIRHLMSQIITEQEAKRKNELKALQAQINPHFLYNTLDSIIWMNENKNHEGVSNMTAALAKLFRISLSQGREVISVNEEIEHAVSYLMIQKMRYKNKFDYKIDVPEHIGQYTTLKLIIQPIIENSIYHGINKIPDKGMINIKVRTEEDVLIFSVSDNGYGISEEQLKSIMTSESTSKHSSGVGLKNVNERLKLYYGEKFGVFIESELEVGTTVYIRIPLMEA